MSRASAMSTAELIRLSKAEEGRGGRGSLRRLPVRATLVKVAGFEDRELEPVVAQMNGLLERLAAEGKTVEATQFGCASEGILEGSLPFYWGLIRWIEQEPEEGR